MRSFYAILTAWKKNSPLLNLLGVSAFSVSLTLFPAIALCCVLSPLAGQIYDKHGAHVLLPLGFVLIAGFAVALSLFIGGGSVWLRAAAETTLLSAYCFTVSPFQAASQPH
jgi:DHA2 family lincomycin resistance protein-like MFS transporter